MKSAPLTVKDRIAIDDLLAEYAWALDTGDVDALVRCFMPNAVVIEEVFEEPDRWVGRENIRRFAEHFRNVPNFPGRQHHISQLLVKGDSKRCSGKSFVFVTECQGEPPYTLRFAGYYDDRLVKSAGKWLFQQRIIRLWDGEVLARFPDRGPRTPRSRPPELVIKKEGK
jgi:ketosteroid isomerase-like protein